MEKRRICPKCKKNFPDNITICPKCHALLADVSDDFEIALSMIPEPVLLANTQEVVGGHLEEALKRWRVPYYSEERLVSVPTGNIKSGTMNIVPICNYYVNRQDWADASEALL